jgi:hypothetical protein
MVAQPGQTREPDAGRSEDVMYFGIGPSPKDIAKEVWNTLKNTFKSIEDAFARIPGQVAGAITAARKDTDTLWTNTKRTVVDAETSVAHTVRFLELTRKEYDAWSKKEEPQFRTHLETFFDDLVEIPAVLTDKVASLQFDVGKSIDPLIADLINATPGVVLWGLDRCLAPVPNWYGLPKEVLAILERMPPLEGPPDKVCPAFRKPNRFPEPWEIHRARTLLRLLVESSKVAMEIVPKDLSVTAVAVAGGGTEVAGHPAKWPFLLAKEVFELADYVLGRYLEEQSACASWTPKE